MSEEDLSDTPITEMLPEYSPPQVRFVIVMPQIQKEDPLETIHKAKLPEGLVEDFPLEEEQPESSPLKLPKKIKARGIPTSYTPRRLFTDYWNSFWHIAFGLFATKFKMLVPAFLFYQFLDMTDINIFVDIIEFLCGYILGIVFNLI